MGRSKFDIVKKCILDHGKNDCVSETVAEKLAKDICAKLQNEKAITEFMENLSDPDDVGTSEYQAIHEVISEADSIDTLRAILEEFVMTAKAMQVTLRNYISEQDQYDEPISETPSSPSIPSDHPSA